MLMESPKKKYLNNSVKNSTISRNMSWPKNFIKMESGTSMLICPFQQLSELDGHLLLMLRHLMAMCYTGIIKGAEARRTWLDIVLRKKIIWPILTYRKSSDVEKARRKFLAKESSRVRILLKSSKRYPTTYGAMQSLKKTLKSSSKTWKQDAIQELFQMKFLTHGVSESSLTRMLKNVTTGSSLRNLTREKQVVSYTLLLMSIERLSLIQRAPITRLERTRRSFASTKCPPDK